MFGMARADDYQPVAWVGRYPLHVTGLLVVIHVACAVIACLLSAFGVIGVLGPLIFDSTEVLHGGVWQLATYPFVHAPSNLLWFAIEMYMLFVFGREVERFIGRRAFIVLYALMIVVPSVLLTFGGAVQRSSIGGSAAIHFGIFVAFATIYPSVELFLRIMAKWVALALAAVYTLQLLASHAWAELTVVWASIAIGFFFVRLRGAGPELAWWDEFKARVQPKPKFQVVPKPSARRVVEPEDVYDSIDPLLDKISKHGIGSLTAAERRALDRARARLLNQSK